MLNFNYRNILALILTATVLITSCAQPPELPPFDPDNGELHLAEGFGAVVVTEKLEGRARQIVVRDNGDIYVKLRTRPSDRVSQNVALRDTDSDGKADSIVYFGNYPYTGSTSTEMTIYKDYLYYSSELVVYRSKLIPGQLLPDSTAEEIVIDDHPHGRHEHIGKPIAFDNKGNMYVPFGAPSNNCQEDNRRSGSPGILPCPQLEEHGGIWKFDAEKPGQRQKDGERFATGIRSIVAFEWNPKDNELYSVVHGRDDLSRMFPDHFDSWESAVLPAEEFIRIKENDDFGWPYCFYDQIQGKRVKAPEYGGDGNLTDNCDQYKKPLMGFPGHWAPNDLLFYQGDQFPDRYKNGAFVAFHGSTNRSPYPQSGYFVCFVPFVNGEPTGEWEVFADGFAQVDPLVSVNHAIYRPMGLAEGPDGSLYIGETQQGKIWRVMFKGDKKNFGEEQLQVMEERKELSHIRTPDKKEDNLLQGAGVEGEKLYNTYCAGCHQIDGKGASPRFPSLAGTDWVTGDKKRLIDVVMTGYRGEMEVNGEIFTGEMPRHNFLEDEQLSAILTYIRSSFGNEASAVSIEEVAKFREAWMEEWRERRRRRRN